MCLCGSATCFWSRQALRRHFHAARLTTPRSWRRVGRWKPCCRHMSRIRHWPSTVTGTWLRRTGWSRLLLDGVAPSLLAPPLNVLRISLHPEGIAPRIVNLAEWAAHLLDRLHRQCEAAADPALIALREELRGYPIPARKAPRHGAGEAVLVPLQLRMGRDVLSFISTTMVFGTPIDVTLSELALEAFFPNDDTTANALRALKPR